MKIYLVMVGEYSDYQFDSAFSTKEAAERREALLDNWYATVIETTLDSIPNVDPCYKPWTVLMDAEGNGQVSPAYLTGGFPRGEDYLAPSHNNRMLFCMWAKDGQHALKIANERRAQRIAEGTWGKEL